MNKSEGKFIKVCKKESGLKYDFEIGPLFELPPPRSWWRFRFKAMAGKKVEVSFGSSGIFPVAGLSSEFLVSFEEWLSLNYGLVLSLFHNKVDVGEFKKLIISV